MHSETETESTPLDEIIAKVESYAKNPKLATPETLTEVANALKDLKSVVDGEDEPEPDDTPEKGGLAIFIKSAKKAKE